MGNQSLDCNPTRVGNKKQIQSYPSGTPFDLFLEHNFRSHLNICANHIEDSKQGNLHISLIKFKAS